MAMTTSLTVGVPVGDLKGGIAWYRQLVGEAEEVEPAPGVWECQIMPSVWLQLFEQAAGGSNPTVIRFESENIEVSRDLVECLSTHVGDIETVPGAVRYFEFLDPFGNRLSFYELLD
jgi:predicted enzyme related to lactoylglutathione lyase